MLKKKLEAPFFIRVPLNRQLLRGSRFYKEYFDRLFSTMVNNIAWAAKPDPLKLCFIFLKSGGIARPFSKE